LSGNTIEMIIKVATDKAVGEIRKFSGSFGTHLKGVVNHAKNLGSRLINLKTIALSAFAGWGISRLIGEWEKLSGIQEKAEATLNQAMISMGRYTKAYSQSILDVASALQKQTTFGDEAILQGAKFLQTYSAISSDVMPRVMAAMTDLAALQGGDMTSAANMLGKASMGMTGELRRVGITVDDATFKSEGFLGVLAQIEQQVQGQAAALRSTKAGGLEAFGNVVGDIKEKVGLFVSSLKAVVAGALLPMVQELNDKFEQLKTSGKLDEWARNWGAKVVEVGASVIETIGKIPTTFLEVKRAAAIAGMGIEALGAAAVDVAAVVAASVNPYWAVKVAINGYRETFPILAAMRDNIDAAGFALGEMAHDAENALMEESKFGNEADKVAAKLRNLAEQIRKTGTEAARPIMPQIVPQVDYKTAEEVLDEILAYYGEIADGIENDPIEPLIRPRFDSEGFEREAARAGEAVSSAVQKIYSGAMETANTVNAAALRGSGMAGAAGWNTRVQGISNPAEYVMGSFQSGTERVPRTGLYELHEGEKVTPEREAKAEKEKVSVFEHIRELISSRVSQTSTLIREAMPQASYAGGTDYVPKTGIYELHQGEKVVPAKEARAEKEKVSVFERIRELVSSRVSQTSTLIREAMPQASYAGGTDYVPRTGLYELHEGEKVVPEREVRAEKAAPSITQRITLQFLGGIKIVAGSLESAENIARKLDGELAKLIRYNRSAIPAALQ